MTISFELDGQEFVALNGSTPSKFTESISFVVNCNTQQKRWMNIGKNYLPKEGDKRYSMAG
jgi:predicted 3-demethylubiquinone-9 3-methyltransferase (glyoxalase superfamily)